MKNLVFSVAFLVLVLLLLVQPAGLRAAEDGASGVKVMSDIPYRSGGHLDAYELERCTCMPYQRCSPIDTIACRLLFVLSRHREHLEGFLQLVTYRYRA